MAELSKNIMSTCTRSQGFGLNLNPLYASAGQKGHTGVDDTCGYGSKVYALKHGLVYKILDREHPANDGSGYWGVFMLCQENGVWIEWQIGHLSKIYVKPGDTVKPWDFIGEEGNRGSVYQGGIRITPEMQDAGDKRGSHRHYNKKILVRLSEAERDTFRGAYITSFSTTFPPNMYKDSEGFLFGVKDYYNGYNGSVDCASDIDNGRKLVDDHFKKPEVVATTTPETIALEREKLQLGIIKQMLDAIQAFLNSLVRSRTPR